MGKQIDVAKSKPAASNTWEVQVALAGNAQEADRVPIEFPGPGKLVGVYPSIILNAAVAGLEVPTVDHIVAELELNQQGRFTSRGERAQQAGSRPSFVTLGALDTRVRDLHLELEGSKPILGLTLAWKRSVTGGPFYPNVIVSLAVFFCPEGSY